MSGWRRTASLALLAGIFLMEGYDLNAMPLAVPHLQSALGLAPEHFGWAFSAVLFGLGGGAALLAPLGDRFGRKPVIVWGTLAAAVTTLATATAASIEAFVLWRLLTGAALGAVLPNCSAMSAELAPAAARARLMTLVSAGIPAGAMIAGLTAPEVVGMGGWQALFILPGVLAALLALATVLVQPGGRPEPASPSANSRSAAPQFELFRRPWLLPFAVYAGMLTLNAVGLYMLSQWAPSVLPRAGFSIDQAARVTGLLQGAGFAAGLGLSWLIDRWKPGWTMIGGFATIALSFLAIGLTSPDPALWTALLLIAGGGVTGMAMALTALTPTLFPPSMLSSAIGMGVLIARAGAIAGPLIGGAMFAAGASPGLFFLALFVPATASAAVALALPRALATR